MGESLCGCVRVNAVFGMRCLEDIDEPAKAVRVQDKFSINDLAVAGVLERKKQRE